MTEQQNPLPQGLTSSEVKKQQEKYGKNQLTTQKKENFFFKIWHVITEPMFLLLLVAAFIYFILGEATDGTIMLVFIIAIISIDVFQEWKTDKTLNALKDLTAPHVTVIRDGKETLIASVDVVPGDLMVVVEGSKIPADGRIIKASDLCVDESSLTGEAEGVWKIPVDQTEKNDDYWRKDYCYTGTLVTQGSGYVVVEKIGIQTEYGKIGANVIAAPNEATPLQKQTGSLVKLCVGIAAVLCALTGIVTYFDLNTLNFGDRLIGSILAGITLAMAMIPEEFPVILTVFLSMGAWRLAKRKSLVRKLPAVETLGAVSVLCVDKTGTITMNEMSVQETWYVNGDNAHFTEIMGLACETEAYDPMEKAMLAYCESIAITKQHLFAGDMLTEYAFTNQQKMMGHVWYHDDEVIVAAKGSPERLLTLCNLTDEEQKIATSKIEAFSKKGLRVIAVAEQHLPNKEAVPTSLLACKLTLCGLVGLEDPPRASVKTDIKHCVDAGIRVVMITGDNGITASSIAKQIGMPNSDHIITGDQLNAMTDEELQEKVKEVSVFSRVIPEHKMRIVKAFKQNGDVVAMTGDGVNDAPALKYADIGIAMGKRGSEVSREAADLILMDDNFSTIVETIGDGRRIYDNIRKAVGYVFTIHIPIAFASLLAPLLGIGSANLFMLPLQVMLLELIIDPTCSIVLERQPAEQNIMLRKPRNRNEKILPLSTLIKSIVQGFVIFIASFGTYYYVLMQNGNGDLARTMGLAIIMIANIFLVQVNSSTTDYAFQSFAKLIKDKVMWIVTGATIIGLLVIIYTPMNSFLGLAPLTASQLAITAGIAAISVLWYELVKVVQRLLKR